jgi:AsmA protein
MQLYGGRGRGVVTLDGSAQVPATAVNLTLDRVAALPLLKDAMGFEWLEGHCSLTIALTGQGVSERQIVEGLNGKAELTTASGAINGFDMGKLLGGIEHGRFADLGVSAGDKTPFSEFAGTFAVANGIATNQDLRLVSPRLRVTGQGTIGLAQRQLDYTINPRIVGGVAVPGAVLNVKNIEIPVRIEGPWEKPNFSLKGQEQILDAVKEIGKNIKSRDVEEAIKGLLGGSDGKRVKPRELLDKLFKKQE